jgi:hypothetical protein
LGRIAAANTLGPDHDHDLLAVFPPQIRTERLQGRSRQPVEGVEVLPSRRIDLPPIHVRQRSELLKSRAPPPHLELEVQQHMKPRKVDLSVDVGMPQWANWWVGVVEEKQGVVGCALVR